MSKKMEKGTENAIFMDGREYTAADLYRLIGLLVGNGVYANELAPTATNEDMSITHGAGHAWISGVAYWNTTPFVLEIATADGSLNRYDSLMLRLNLSINEVYAVIVQGSFATKPTPPAVTRNAETYDLKICDIYIPAGCTKITQAQIVDTRLDSSVCGVPVFPVDHLDMTTFYRQVSNDMESFREKEQSEFSIWAAEQEESHLSTMKNLVEIVRNASDDSKAEILNLLDQLNGLLDADTVGLLINQINDKIPFSGGDMTGEIRMNGNPVSGLNTPTEDTQAANKAYVDASMEASKTYTDAAQAEAGAYTDTAKAEAKAYTDTAKAEAKSYTDSKRLTKTATITTTWSGSGPYTQTVTVSGILATDMPHITPVYSTTNATAIAQKEAWNCVSKAVTAADKLTFTCFEDKPATAIPIQIEVIR